MRGFKWSSRRRKSNIVDEDGASGFVYNGHETIVEKSRNDGNSLPRSRSSSHAAPNVSVGDANKRKSTFLLSSRFSKSSESFAVESSGTYTGNSGSTVAASPVATGLATTPVDSPPVGEKSSSSSTIVTLDESNYDSTILKVGWLNRSNGQYLQSTLPIENNTHTIASSDSSSGAAVENKFYEKIGGNISRENVSSKNDSVYNTNHNSSLTSLHSSSSSSANLSSSESLLVPDYKLYRAQLKGPLLLLYKSGLPNSVKFFDPLISQQHQQQQQHQQHKLTNKNTNTSKKKLLKYVSDSFPHPELKFDKNKDNKSKIISGSLESLCHTILFWNNTTRTIINLILVLPMLDDFTKSMNYFIQYTNYFSSIHANNNNNNNNNNDMIEEKNLGLIIERISLLIKTIVDVMPSFLLSQAILNSILILIKILKQDNLKIIVMDKIAALNKLTSFKNLQTPQYNDLNLLNVNFFLTSIDPVSFADTFHSINLKFDNNWSPKVDYSLLYDTVHVNNLSIHLSQVQNDSGSNSSDNTEVCPIQSLNPSVFNNEKNLHILSKILTSQLFSSMATPKLRSEVLTKWIKIGCRLEQIGDMSAWLAIATVICSLPVLRLSKSWNLVEESTLKTLFRDWIPTILQLERKQFSSKSTNSVFILAPPNLDSEYIRKNVISYFGDLTIHADKLNDDIKLKYLEKKINRTKNAFHKWEQRLEETLEQKPSSSSQSNSIDSAPKPNDKLKDEIYLTWRFFLSAPKLHITKLMQLSLNIESPAINQSISSKTGSISNSSLLLGSYLPILFNELQPNFSFFPKNTLIEMSALSKNQRPLSPNTSRASVSGGTPLSVGKLPPPRSSARLSKSIPISEPMNVMRASNIQHNNDVNKNAIDKISSKQITGFEAIDSVIIQNITKVKLNESTFVNLLSDLYNIDSHVIRLSNGLVFKSIPEDSRECVGTDFNTRLQSDFSEHTEHFSQLSIQTNNDNSFKDSVLHDSTFVSNSKDNRVSINPQKSIENLAFLKDITRFSNDFDESTIINIVLKSSSLERMIDLLVLTSTIFSKLANTNDLKNYYENTNKRITNKKIRDKAESTLTSTLVRSDSSTNLNNIANSNSIGLLDFAFVKLSMNNTLYTETFFNSYKMFTTTTSLLEELAKRFIKAKSCAFEITALSAINADVTNTADKQSFPQWNLPVENEENVTISFIMMIHLGVLEAIHHLVKYHYSDFCDDLSCNSTFLDLFKILEEEVKNEWPLKLKKIKEGNTHSNDQIEDVDSLYSKMDFHFNNIRSLYQKQLYRPVNNNKTIRKVAMDLNAFSHNSYDNLCRSLHNFNSLDGLTKSFVSMKHNDYQGILLWIDNLDSFVSQYFEVISKRDWLTTSHQLQLLYNQSTTSLYNYPSHIEALKLLNTGKLDIEGLEISNIFTWLSTVIDDEKQLFIKTLPVSIQLIFKLHASLTHFFVVMITNPHFNMKERVNNCCIILQALNYIRWKNSSLDLFDSPQTDDNESSISPHIPSFLETSLANAILSPLSRNYEASWKLSHSKLRKPSNDKSLRSICDILRDIDNSHIDLFVEAETSLKSKKSNYCPCPGWSVSSLLELSLFLSSTSSMNTEGHNFDKIRCVDNTITNIMRMVPSNKEGIVNDIKHFKILFTIYSSNSDVYWNRIKEKSKEEAQFANLNEVGLFNEILIFEVEKLKREKDKKEMLISKENDHKRATLLQNVATKNKRNSVIIPSSYQISANGNISSGQSSTVDSLNKRGSMSASSRNSMVATNNHSGVSRRLGDFFKSSFSMGNFSSSVSNQSLHSLVAQDLKTNGSLSPTKLPEIELLSLQETKPLLVLKTFEIKSIVPLVNHKMVSSFAYSFKILMENGSDHTIQATNMQNMNEWINMIKISKRYSFHSQKFKGKTHNKVFGVPLEDICERENTNVPTIVVKLLEVIEERGLDELGLYRIPGSTGSINALKNAFDEEGAVNNNFSLDDDRWFEINAIAGCFKMYLRELPDSLLTNEKVEEFAAVAIKFKSKKLSEADYTKAISVLLSELPVAYYQTMKRIVMHLNTVHKHVSNNRMDASNLAIVFSMSFIDQDNFATSMGTTLGAIQTILQHFIGAPETFFRT